MVYWYMYTYSIDNNDNIRQVTHNFLWFLLVNWLIKQPRRGKIILFLTCLICILPIWSKILSFSPKLQLTPWFKSEKRMVGILFTYEDRDNEILYGRSKLCQKVKNLVWRVRHDYFPTCVRLIRRGFTCPTKSVICSKTIEDTMHAIFTFPHKLQLTPWFLTS